MFKTEADYHTYTKKVWTTPSGVYALHPTYAPYKVIPDFPQPRPPLHPQEEFRKIAEQALMKPYESCSEDELKETWTTFLIKHPFSPPVFRFAILVKQQENSYTSQGPTVSWEVKHPGTHISMIFDDSVIERHTSVRSSWLECGVLITPEPIDKPTLCGEQACICNLPGSATYGRIKAHAQQPLQQKQPEKHQAPPAAGKPEQPLPQIGGDVPLRGFPRYQPHCENCNPKLRVIGKQQRDAQPDQLIAEDAAEQKKKGDDAWLRAKALGQQQREAQRKQFAAEDAAEQKKKADAALLRAKRPPPPPPPPLPPHQPVRDPVNMMAALKQREDELRRALPPPAPPQKRPFQKLVKDFKKKQAMYGPPAQKNQVENDEKRKPSEQKDDGKKRKVAVAQPAIDLTSEDDADENVPLDLLVRRKKKKSKRITIDDEE
jgi:hypothetical protein